MDGRELRKAILREHSGGGTPYEVEAGMTALANSTSRAAGHSLWMITTFSEVSS
jgi:hypothetical protein